MKELKIGRNPDNDIQFPQDPSVSRNHAILIIGSGGYSIQDLGSSNGTFVNGNRINGVASIREHDIVKVGNSLVPWMQYANINPQEARTQLHQQAPSYQAPQPQPTTQSTSNSIVQENLPNASGALVCGLLGLIFSIWGFLGVIGLILSIIGVALGAGAKAKYQRNPEKYRRGSYSNANAGMVMGIIGICLFVLVIIILIAALSH